VILGSSALREAIASGAVVCTPPARIEGSHIDITLGAMLPRRGNW
jgi:hypothetical protein